MSEQDTAAAAAPTTTGATAPAEPTRVKERRHLAQGMGGGYWQTRVRELGEGEPIPNDAQVTDEPASDWANE